jgi:hypothetical protein
VLKKKNKVKEQNSFLFVLCHSFSLSEHFNEKLVVDLHLCKMAGNAEKKLKKMSAVAGKA